MALILGLLVSLPIAVIGIAGFMAMDGIFRAALYQFAATGAEHSYFPSSILKSAYVAKDDRGDWGGGGSMLSGAPYVTKTRDADYYSGGMGLMR